MGTIEENLDILYTSIGIGAVGALILMFGVVLAALASSDKDWVGDLVMIVGGSTIATGFVLGTIAGVILLILNGLGIVVLVAGAVLVVMLIASLIAYVMS